MFAISRHLEESVVISTYCTQPYLPKKKKRLNKFFIEDAAVLSGWDKDEDEELVEYKDNNKYFGDDFVVANEIEEEEYKVSMPSCLKNDDPEDSDEYNERDESKGRKR